MGYVFKFDIYHGWLLKNKKSKSVACTYIMPLIYSIFDGWIKILQSNIILFYVRYIKVLQYFRWPSAFF